MPEPTQNFIYRVIRYTPNLIRDEWINIGVLLHSPADGRAAVRLIEEPAEFSRLRRLHPGADEALLRSLAAELDSQLAPDRGDAAAAIAELDETLSNLIQLSPQRGLLADDFEAEMDRLFQNHVVAPRYRGRIAQLVENTRSAIRRKMADVFRRTGVLAKLQRGVRVEEFTHKGDPFHFDFSYQRNGTRGFIQALPLGREPAPAKVLAFTAERVRARLQPAEFAAVTEVAPRSENPLDAFISSLLRDQAIRIVPLPQMEAFARELGATLR